MPRKRTSKSVKKACDKLWSQCVRLRDPHCCKCGKMTTEAHHIFGRRALATRWELDNGLGLCPYCHKFDKFGFEQSPYDKANMKIILDKIGDAKFGELQIRSRQIYQPRLPDLLDLETDLQDQLDWLRQPQTEYS